MGLGGWLRRQPRVMNSSLEAQWLSRGDGVAIKPRTVRPYAPDKCIAARRSMVFDILSPSITKICGSLQLCLCLPSICLGIRSAR